MKKSIPLVIVIIVVGILTACETDYRKKAKGGIDEFIVIMDSTQWDSETANAIRNTFGKLIFTLPNPEENYNLRFNDFKTQKQLDYLKSMKNIIFAAPLEDSTNVARQIRSFLDASVKERVKAGDSFAFPIKDQWYRDQYALVLTSNSDAELAEKILSSDRALLNDAQQRELERVTSEVFKRKEQKNISDSLWTDYGFKVRIQHDYEPSVDTTDFKSYRRYLPENDRWMWVWWKDNVNDIGFLDDTWINTTRDSLNQIYVQGSSEDKYISTEYRRPVETHSFTKGNLIAYETLGTWQMINGAMGGPFVNFTYYDSNTNRLFMVEYSQFAPKVNRKLPFVRQFRAMGRTFESDSTYTAN